MSIACFVAAKPATSAMSLLGRDYIVIMDDSPIWSDAEGMRTETSPHMIRQMIPPIKSIGPRHKAFLGSENNEKHDNPPTIAPASPALRLIPLRYGRDMGWCSSNLEEETKISMDTNN